MELVYLWVNEYKNFRNQEFNFGSDYIFKLETSINNERHLNLSDNNKYIDNLFSIQPSSSISTISAIIGKNGTGKSNAIELIRLVLANMFFIANNTETRVIAVFKKRGSPNSKYYYASSKLDFALKVNPILENIFSNQNYTVTVFYNPYYEFNNVYEINNTTDIDISSKAMIFYDFKFLQETRSEDVSLLQENLEYHNFLSSTRQLFFIFGTNYYEILGSEILLPKSISIELINLENVTEKLFHGTRSDKLILSLYRNDSADVHYNSGQSIQKWLEHLLVLYWFLTSETDHKNRKHLQLRDNSISSLEKKIEQLIFDQSYYDSEILQNYLIAARRFFLEESNVVGKIEYQYIGDVRTYEIDSKTREFVSEYIRLITHISEKLGKERKFGFILFNWLGLSSGERALLDLFSRLYFAKEKIENEVINNVDYDKPKGKWPNTVLLLLDEAENSFHLQWQKEYISRLIKIMPKIFDKEQTSIQIIFTTHSPVTLSDLPSYNCIYLNKGTDIFNKPQISFAANINELIVSTFFLQDGTIGSFAKLKIQEIIDWCKSELSNEDIKKEIRTEKVKKVIDIIDEPVIKLKLTEIYVQTIRKDFEIEKLRIQKEYIERRLDELKAQKND